jgi:hypothetical protein
VRGVGLFSAVSGDDVRAAQILTGVTMAAFIGVGLTPALHAYTRRIRFGLLVAYLLACGVFLGSVLVR